MKLSVATPLRLSLLLLLPLALAGCNRIFGGSDYGELLAQPDGVADPFFQALAAEYRDVAVDVKWEEYDSGDARRMAEKGLHAQDRLIAVPETLERRRLSDEDQRDLSVARQAVLSALQGGGRDRAPQDMAVALARFDCWVIQAESRGWYGAPVPCRVEFERAMEAVLRQPPSDVGTAQALPPAPVALPVLPPEPEPLPEPLPAVPGKDSPIVRESGPPRPLTVPPPGVTQPVFPVFFASGSSAVVGGETAAVRRAADEFRRLQPARVTLAAFTDAQGDAAANEVLARRRAEAVRDELVEAGIPAARIFLQPQGERGAGRGAGRGDRRVEIRFE